MHRFRKRSRLSAIWWRSGQTSTVLTRALARVLPVALIAGVAGVPAGAAQAVEARPTKQDCPAQLPDENAALTTARLCGGPVAITGLTTETDQAVATAKGTIEWKHHFRPVRVKQAAGWVPVDTDLAYYADGTVGPKAAAVDLSFSGGGKTSMVTVGTGDAEFRLAAPFGSLPKPVLDGNVATYPEVLPGVDLQLQADVDGYSQVLVVKNRAAAQNPKLAKLAFGVSGKGVKTRADKAGNLRVEDRKGNLVLAGNTPLAWDATPSARSRTMPVTVAGGVLTVTPDQKLLAGDTTVYPVSIDPGVTLARASWAYVDSATPTTAYWNSGIAAQVGTSNSGTSVKRAFFNVDLASTAVAGKHVTAASLDLNLTGSGSCTARQMDLYSTTAASSTTTWNAQPTWSSLIGSVVAAKGYSSSCPAGAVSIDATSGARTAVNAGSATLTLGLRSPNETDNTYFKQFDNNPALTVTYTDYATVTELSTSPSTACATGTGRPYINTATPQLKARVTDPEGALVRPEFAWFDSSGTAIGGAQPTPAQASGQLFSTTVPSGAFTNGGTYSWKVRGYDGTAWGSWSTSCEFTVDTTAPSAAPTVTSTTYPSGAWSGAAGTAGTFTLAAGGVTDVATYLYGLDADPTTELTASSLGASASLSLTPAEDGPHTLKVQTRDRAGNLSAVTSYSFAVGTGAVTAPAAGTQTAGKVTLSGLSKSTSTGITYQWRRADTDSWVSVPVGDVTTAAGAAISAWPVATSGSGAYPNLVWNVAQTVNNAEAGTDALNGPVQVRASLSGTSTGTSTAVSFTLDRNKAQAATAEIGPGSVNLLTGNYSLSASDASTIGGLGVSREFNSRLTGDVDPLFGPGWTSGIEVAETGTYTELTVTGSLVQIGLASGTTVGFTKKATTGTGATFTPEVGAEGYTLTYTTTGDTYLLTDPRGNEVTFSNQATGVYAPTALKSAGVSGGSKISWESVTVGGATVIRPTGVVATVPDGISSCATLVRGCRALTFIYATATTASSTSPGDYLGRIKQVSLTAWDPDRSTPALRTVVLAQYSYHSTGRLAAAWDPRLDYTSGGSTLHVATAYTYNTDGTIATLTPPGEQAWQFTYTTVPTDSGAGRLYKVTRSALSAGTAVETVVYNTLISGSGAPVDMAPNVNRWGQTAVPVDATAVYPADIVPDGNPATATLPTYSDDDRVTVTYMDTNGRAVNTMQSTPPGTTNTAT